MDLNEELCKPDFFDYVKSESGLSELTPVAFVDSMDYSITTTDSNNNSICIPSSGPMKSFLDEMLLADSLVNNNNSHSSSSSSSLELLGTFHWSTSPQDDPNGVPSSGVNLFDTNPPWGSGSCAPPQNEEGEVTTLTNILDPLFISFSSEEDSKMDHYFSGNVTSEGQGSTVISSDLISSTFLCERDLGVNGGEAELLTWRGSLTAGSNSDTISEESLLRSALQAGHGPSSSSSTKSHLLQIPTTVLAKETEMTELRKVLSFPPLLNANHNNNNSPSPHSSDQDVLISEESNLTLPSDTAYYELKVLDSVFIEPEPVILPNIEELIMNRIDHNDNNNNSSKNHNHHSNNNNNNGMRKDISERKINSTTLSVKWTYTPSHESNKVRRRKKGALSDKKKGGGGGGEGISICDRKDSSNEGMLDPLGSDIRVKRPSSPTDVTNNNVGRKERSLHYCTICSKGFKDKYSVNVHVRTHTGEKPFGCHLCGKNFRQKAHLAKHLQTHVDKDKSNSQKGSKSRVSTTTTTSTNNNTILNATTMSSSSSS